MSDMTSRFAGKIVELPQYRGKTRVFDDRRGAGAVLAEMLEDFRPSGAIVLAIPAGGVPVAACVASALGLDLDVAVVSKMTPPWNSEVGYGAIAFDQTVLLNDALIADLGLTDSQVKQGMIEAAKKVKRRLQALRGDRPMPDLSGRTAILVDDGLASGFTMRAAVAAMKKAGAGRVVVAVPTAHGDTVAGLSAVVSAIYCPNIRRGRPYAVADAYRQWRDVDESEAAEILREFHH